MTRVTCALLGAILAVTGPACALELDGELDGEEWSEGSSSQALLADEALAGGDLDDIGVLGGCSSFPPTPCGELHNNTYDTWVRVSLNWTCSQAYAPLGSSCPQNIHTVNPRSHMGGGNVDVDAFEVPAQCTFWGLVNSGSFSWSPGWHKFSSWDTVTITYAECRR